MFAAGEGSLVRFLDAAVFLAESGGYLPLGSDTKWLRALPSWLADLQQPGGLDRLESRLGVPIPAAVREFWGIPDLVRLLDAWGWDDFLQEEPRVFSWSSMPPL